MRGKDRTLAALALAGMLAACVVPPPEERRPEFAPRGLAYGADQRYCDRNALTDVLRPTTGNAVGTAAGAAAGGLIASQLSGGNNAGVTLAGILAGALVGGAIARSMEPVDQACVSQALNYAPNGAPIEWQNPANHASYWVTPTRTEMQPDGTPCRYYTTEALDQGRREAATGYACRQADGTWRNLR